jgi:hypothetical protein
VGGNDKYRTMPHNVRADQKDSMYPWRFESELLIGKTSEKSKATKAGTGKDSGGAESVTISDSKAKSSKPPVTNPSATAASLMDENPSATDNTKSEKTDPASAKSSAAIPANAHAAK